MRRGCQVYGTGAKLALKKYVKNLRNISMITYSIANDVMLSSDTIGSEMAQKTRVLVVDDEAAVVRFVRAGLNALGYEVTTATGGEEALELVAKKQFDIVLLDVFMEPVSGLDVLERLGPDRKLPVIVFSAGNSVIEKVMQAGADAFVAKPVRPDQLAQKIEEVLKRKKVG